ncbi:MAG: MBL fold metallo-hydrolase [Elusimicrobia bacterium]|nr:MBL fold metallo-hydrolase [Elusimicrobiota bacterium]
MKKFYFVLSFLLLFFCGSLYAQISVEYFGGAGRVSGSCALLKTEDMSIIVDCGNFYEEGGLPAYNDTIDKKLINADAMVLTHAHNDHSGKIPLLINAGYRGKIYCTEATRKLLFETFDDGWNHSDIKQKYFWSKNSRLNIEKIHKGVLTLHWYYDCRKNIKNIEDIDKRQSLNQLKTKYNIGMKLCKNCLKKELEKTQKYFIDVPYKDITELSEKVNFVLFDAGHITGSASVFFNIYDDGKIKKVVFSGDLGTGLSKITPDKDIIPKADYVFIENTYGSGTRDVSFSNYEVFQRAISNAIKDNKIVWIPSLSMHRTQKILYEIKQAQLKGLLNEDVPIYSLSPSSNGITKLYEKELKNPSSEKWFKDEVYEIGSFLPAKYITQKQKNEEFAVPCIIISASGMMNQGVSYSLLNKLLKLNNVEVFLVSYAAPQTPAGQLKKGTNTIKTKYGKMDVAAKINVFNIFSDHADSIELLRWLTNQDANTQLYLVHGEKDVLKKAQKNYKLKGFRNTKIAVIGEQVLK